MHGRWCRFGRDRLVVPGREGLRRFRPEPLGPGFGAHTPGGRRRTTLDLSRPVAPDVHDLDHPAFAAHEAAPPRRADDEAPFTQWGSGHESVASVRSRGT